MQVLLFYLKKKSISYYGQYLCYDFFKVLLAVGRYTAKQSLDFLGLQELGVAFNQENGQILAKREQSQSHPNIYAVGDALNCSTASCALAAQAACNLLRRLYSGSMELVMKNFLKNLTKKNIYIYLNVYINNLI